MSANRSPDGCSLSTPDRDDVVIATRVYFNLEQAVGALDVALSDGDVSELTAPYTPQEVREHD